MGGGFSSCLMGRLGTLGSREGNRRRGRGGGGGRKEGKEAGGYVVEGQVCWEFSWLLEGLGGLVGGRIYWGEGRETL